MNVVFIVPTGVGAEIGGHSGDATPAAKLVASVCDKVIVHPNVVNASDLNEMTENMLYVEGSILDRFLEGKFGLKEVFGNKILLAVNEVKPEIINAVSAARVTIGAEIEIVKLKTPIGMIAFIDDEGKASGEILGIEDAVNQLNKYDFDVLVVNTPIKSEDSLVKDYLVNDGGINLWGGVEAKLSRKMSELLNKPVFHAPVEAEGIFKTFNDVVDPRKAAEIVSTCYVHCCLKGGHKAPKISTDSLSYKNTDINFLISPTGVFGKPHKACLKAGIPIIVVQENKTIFDNDIPNSIIVKNYLEAVGVISAKKAGVSISSVSRPLKKTVIRD